MGLPGRGPPFLNAAPALKRADDLCATAFCTIYSVDRAIFNTGASAEQRFAAARVRLPTTIALLMRAHAGAALLVRDPVIDNLAGVLLGLHQLLVCFRLG